jgi:hypothetical protein
MARHRFVVPVFADVVCFSLIAAVTHLARGDVSYLLVLWIVERIW